MKLTLFVLAACLSTGLSLQASSDKIEKFQSMTVGFEVYTNVKVLDATKTDLFFTHGFGLSNAKLKYLAPALQQQFKYNAVEAEKAERQRLEQTALYLEHVARSWAMQQERSVRRAQIKAKAAMETDEAPSEPASQQSLVGKPAPVMEVERWISGKPDMRGKCTLVAFWAPWSPQCQKQISNLNELQKKYENQLVVVGISAGTEVEILESPAPDVEFACAVDSESKCTSAAGVTKLPCVMLLDSQNIVRYQGPPSALKEAFLKDLLANVE